MRATGLILATGFCLLAVLAPTFFDHTEIQLPVSALAIAVALGCYELAIRR
ncbi:MAG TPA: hypothetical protein VG125_07820 [Pirellulales bacterium]|jgi:hypothetical protein|nr:hypothetical protein [Pirellulales bacterium]